MRLRLVLVVLAVMVVGGAGVALAAHPTVAPSAVPSGFLAAHAKVNNIPLATLERALRSKKADLFIEHGHLDPNQATTFYTHPGPTFYVVVSGAVINENVSGSECRRKTYAQGPRLRRAQRRPRPPAHGGRRRRGLLRRLAAPAQHRTRPQAGQPARGVPLSVG